MKSKILIIGSNGALGQYLVKKVINSFGIDNLVISDYKENRLVKQKNLINKKHGKDPLSRLIDVSSEDSIRKGLNSVDIVLIAIQQKEPIIQRVCFTYNISSIDLSVNPNFFSKVLSLNNPKTRQSLQLITGGLFPGLSGILAWELGNNSAQNEPVDVGLLQSANGTNGKTGVSDMLKIFDKKVELMKEDNTLIKSGFSHKKEFSFPEPFGNKALRLANFIEREYLKVQGIKSNYWTSFDQERLNKSIGLLKQQGFLKLFKYPIIGSFLSVLISKQKQNDKRQIIGLIAKNRSSQISIILTSDYEATASCTIAFAKKMLINKGTFKGVKFPFEIFTFEEIKSDLNDVILELKILNSK